MLIYNFGAALYLERAFLAGSEEEGGFHADDGFVDFEGLILTFDCQVGEDTSLPQSSSSSVHRLGIGQMMDQAVLPSVALGTAFDTHC